MERLAWLTVNFSGDDARLHIAKEAVFSDEISRKLSTIYESFQQGPYEEIFSLPLDAIKEFQSCRDGWEDFNPNKQFLRLSVGDHHFEFWAWAKIKPIVDALNKEIIPATDSSDAKHFLTELLQLKNGTNNG